MANATLSRGGTTVTIPLVESGGTPLVSRDIGKPDLNIQSGGTLNPRFRDSYSGIQTHTIVGVFNDSSAYSDAIALADLVKSQDLNDPLVLDYPDLNEFVSDIDVALAPQQEQALTLTYEPGRRNWVQVQISLIEISDFRSNGNVSANTPTASGNGDIQLQDVDLTTDITVERSIGRPNDSASRRPGTDSPVFTHKRKRAFDAFEISFQEPDTAVQTVSDLTDIFTARLGNTPLTLDFDGAFGMGNFNVVPQGSTALRHTRVAGEQGVSMLPTLKLRRVQS